MSGTYVVELIALLKTINKEEAHDIKNLLLNILRIDENEWQKMHENRGESQHVISERRRNVKAIYNELENDNFNINHLFSQIKDLSLLHLAAVSGYEKAVDYLINKGANVNLQNKYGISPLYSAIHHGHEQVADHLIKKGANVNLQDKNGFSLLHFAAEYGHEKVVDYLIKKGATVNLQDKHGTFPLHLAAEYGYENIVNHLIKKGDTVNLQDKYGVSPLHLAAEYGHVNVAKLLLENDANVNMQCNLFHETPLHLAAGKNDLRMMRLLINNGACIDSQNQGGRTPMHMAFRGNFLEGMKLLRKNGADPSLIPKSEAEDVGISVGIGIGCVTIASGYILLLKSDTFTVSAVFAVIGITIASALIAGNIAYCITHAAYKHKFSNTLEEMDLIDLTQGRQVTP
ncbi:ankyrin repeat domain-containing protein [Wolbachia endosymbiont of Pentalonia nigronervosa]|uniref:ankyrin repeat domain-containing protein n=1 Tax=Wolbachia endosymbiont of Pentalonia nigronervosa TaxID=1301914 RepID=UPI00165F81AC|nr:ankyrin repeat domain-containing protein [Wolbachia endosymbiont of Pentalonia nigronervosa]MBD0391224.1 ankyrin repeat domain-containing protein [Wolbachia endosymbiont of Pentalonia nigronervosa]